MARLVVAVFALVLLTLSPLSAQGAGNWPTTQFKVFSGNPFVGSNLVDEMIGFDPMEFEDLFGPSPDAIAEIERALSEAAQWYEKNGFPPPLLEPLIDTENGPAYQVYVCSQEWDQALTEVASNILENAGVRLRWGQCVGDSSGSYASECGDDPTRTKIIVINSERSLDDSGKLNEVAYQTLAHELMHAIIANTQFGKQSDSCTVGHWITEGIPDAISFDLAEDLWQSRYFHNNSDGALVKRYGYRPYSVRLPESRKSAGAPGTTIKFDFKYTASSFWRFIADLNNGWKDVLVNPKGNGLLDLTIPGSVESDGSQQDWQSEITWLNTGLKGRFNRDLNTVYSLFVNNLVFRIPPFKNYRGRPAEDILPKWAEKLFADCQVVDLSSVTHQTISLSVKELAAACIWVEPMSLPGLVQVSFQTSSTDRDMLEGISIGMAGTMLVSRAAPIAQSPLAPALYLASWKDYPQDGSKRTLYVVSNVARVPKDSEARHLVLTVSRPANSNSALATVPLPPPRVAPRPQQPGYNKHARSLAQQQSATAKMVAQQMNLDKETLSTNVSSATEISRRANQPGCTEPFKYDVCGPHLTINLGLMPGTYIIPGQTNAQGGMAAQVFGGFQAMSQTSMLDTQDRVQHLTAVIDSIDGSQVGIAIPLIDYGYTGTVSTAAISVDMSGGRTWRAIGPPDAQHRTRLTGRVTIDEYSPFVMRGSFSAPLAEFVETVYTPRQTVTGTFTSVAPWLSDERVQILHDSQEQMADDIANTMGIPAGMVHSMKRDGTWPGNTPAASGSASASGNAVQTECNCECSIKPFADELCELLCEEEFAACD